MTLQLGIIGAGAIGAKHAEAAQASGVEIVHVADRDQSRAEQLAKPYTAKASSDEAALIADDAVQAVVIGVPNCFHKPLALAAMQAGKDVLLEKPMALSADECDELNACAAKTGRILQVGYVHRYSAYGAGAKRVIDTGDLGDIYHAKAHLYCKRSIPGLGRWFTTKSIAGGGALIDIGVHLIDLAMHLLNFPEVASVTGSTYNKFGSKMRDYVYESMWAGPPDYEGTFDVEDSAHAMIQFKNGSSLDLQVAWAGNFPAKTLPDSQMAFFGDQAGLSFELFGSHLSLAHEMAGSNVDTTIPLPAFDAMAAQMADFARAVEDRHVGGATGQQGRTVQGIIDAIYQSSENNRPITFD